MGTTSNYSWPIPEDTDLVKNGAEAIRDLGNAIDTSAADFGGGLVHINTQTFSAVSSVFVDNVFTSAYKNYRIVARYTSTAVNFLARFRDGGTPDSGSVYNTNGLQGQTTTASAINSSGSTSFSLAQSPADFLLDVYAVADIYGAQLSANTFVVSTFRSDLPSLGLRATKVNTTTSYDGIEFNLSSGTSTGSFSIFGYKD